MSSGHHLRSPSSGHANSLLSCSWKFDLYTRFTRRYLVSRPTTFHTNTSTAPSPSEAIRPQLISSKSAIHKSVSTEDISHFEKRFPKYFRSENLKVYGRDLRFANVLPACGLDPNINTLSNSPIDNVPVLLACFGPPLLDTRNVLFKRASLPRAFSLRVENAFLSSESGRSFAAIASRTCSCKQFGCVVVSCCPQALLNWNVPRGTQLQRRGHWNGGVLEAAC